MEHIRTALASFLKRRGLDERLRRQRLLTVWPQMVGEEFAAYSRARQINRGTLWVEAAGSTWVAQLMMVRREVMERYQKNFGRVPFKDIRVTVGVFEAPKGNGEGAGDG
jgi:predicted nucleic acid-binding Zn ribbon protein